MECSHQGTKRCGERGGRGAPSDAKEKGKRKGKRKEKRKEKERQNEREEKGSKGGWLRQSREPAGCSVHTDLAPD